MRTVNQHRRIVLVRIVFAALALSLIVVSCSKERSLSPAPVHYRLYASAIHSGGTVINVIDCDTDSLVDVITGFTPYSAHNGLSISPDGRYACIIQQLNTMAGDPALVMDLRTHEIIARLPSSIRAFKFLRTRNVLLGMCPDSMLVFSNQTFAMEEVWPIRYGLYKELPGSQDMIGVEWPLAPSELTHDHSKFMIFNPETGIVRDTFRIRESAEDSPLSISSFRLFDDRRSLLALSGGNLVRYDYIQKRIMFKVWVGEYWSTISISPDQTEIWLPESSDELHPGGPRIGDILTFDARTGASLQTISTDSLRLDRPATPIPLLDLIFVPTLSKAYAGSFYGRPSLLVINTETHEITNTLFGSQQLQLFQLTIAPY